MLKIIADSSTSSFLELRSLRNNNGKDMISNVQTSPIIADIIAYLSLYGGKTIKYKSSKAEKTMFNTICAPGDLLREACEKIYNNLLKKYYE